LVHERADLREHVPGSPVSFLAAQARNDAERAGVVAADRDRDPSRIRAVATRRQRGRKGLQRLPDLDRRAPVVSCALEEDRQCAEVVGAEDDVNPRRPLDDRAPVLLGQAAADSDLHVGVAQLGRA
jgi:hypothetical protein